MAISAQDVKALREKTGVGMMECKKALTESNGDMDKAIDYLREKGLAAAEKKSSRIAAEGVVLSVYDKDANKAVIVEVNSETDFVAKNEKFQSFVSDIAKTIIAQNPADVEALSAAKMVGSDQTVEEVRQSLVLAIGENMKLRRFAVVDGPAATYVHGGGMVGVVVTFAADKAVADTADFAEMGKCIAMQVAAMNPGYLDSDSVPAEVLDHEKEIMVAQMKEDPKMANKPDQVLEKIVTGKIGKFYKENCLVDQEFVRSDLFKGSVKGYADSVAKKLGGDIKITGFIRYERGEGLEKRNDNFAEEIASLVK